MNKLNKTIVGIIVAIVVLWGGYAAYTGDRATNAPIKVGAIYTFTGMGADIGEEMKKGTEIAVEEINSKGGINGRQVQVIYEDAPDSAGKPAINAAHKLMNIDRVSAILDYPYSGLSAIGELAVQNKIPVMDIIDSSDEIGSFGDWVFGSGIYADGVGGMVADFTINTLKIKRVAILTGKDNYLYAISSGFEKKFKELGGEIVAKEEFVVGETDLRSPLLKMKDHNPEAIFVAHLGEGGVAVKQANEIGFKGVFLGSDTFSLADVTRVAGSTLDGRTYFGLWKSFDQNTPEQMNFAAKYKAKYGTEAGDYLFYNVLGYDGMMVLAEAIEKSDGSPEGIQKALYAIKDFPGLSGPITIDKTGINHDPKAAIVMYKDGKIVRYAK